ncbi:MAG: ClpX C4-type zinc finger protein [Thermomicrobiales bacterium]
MSDERYRCSFCNKSQAEVRRLVFAQPSGVAICNECAAMVMEILEAEDAAEVPLQDESNGGKGTSS